MKALTLLICSTGVCLAAGCGGGSVSAPTYAPAQAAQEAFAEHDTNRDGTLDVEELERCPSLKSFARNVGKKTVTVEDLENRLTKFRESGVGAQAVGVKVMRRGAALAGATVTFVPEKFLGASIKPATGTTDNNGDTQVNQEGQPGAAPGFYRIEVSLKGGDGQETLPAKFNASTIFGEEISPTMRGIVVLKLNE